MRVFHLFLCIILILCGCRSTSPLDSGDYNDFAQRASHSKKQSGDFGAFLIQQVARYGGHSVASDSPTALTGTWYFESDKNGFAAQLYDVPFARVQSFMQKVYGSPIDVVSTNLQGQLHGLYGVSQIGVAIQFFGRTNGVGFICVEKENR